SVTAPARARAEAPRGEATVTTRGERALTRLALESRYLPDERTMRVGGSKSALLNNGEHPPRRVRKRPELHAPQPEKQVLRGDHETRNHISLRITEDEHTARVIRGRFEK